jgi:hypothetical protein
MNNIFKSISDNFLDSKSIINIIINVGLIATFISIFFFTYASKVEEEIVKNQAKIMVNDIMQVVNPSLNDTAKKMIMEYTLADMSEEDKAVLESNEKLINSGYSILIIVFLVTQVVGLILAIYFNYDYFNIILVNVIILVFVGLTEYIFLNMIGASYVSVDTNYIKWKILTSVQKKLGHMDVHQEWNK